MSAADEQHNRETLLRLGTMLNDVFVGCATDALASITDGSPVTGSPGQPVATGALKNSFQLVFESPDSAVIGTNLDYAEAIEEGVGRFGPLTLRSSVGGFHSIALTVASFDRIIADVKARVARSA